ncbi:MAG: polysaccharide deacetylase family protein [Clostridia bacterium]|nr:polysaccharide deacetylase family protein [Clostridia bacterium]
MKLKNKFVSIFALIFTLILICCFSVFNYTKTASLVYLNGETRKVPIYSVDRSDNKIAISFDCAYGADYTDSLLNTLDNYGVKCTFFVVEFWVKKYPEKVAEIIKRGHEIGTHSSTHPYMSKLDSENIKKQLESSVNLIETITNKKVELFRPPYGDYSNAVINEANKLGLYTIQWSVDSLDWKNVTEKQIADRVISKTKSGSIILCHNNGLNTYKALPQILSTLQEKGFKFVKISELIYKDNYTIDSFGVQHVKG